MKRIDNIISSLRALEAAIVEIESADQIRIDIENGIKRDFFRPQEDERLWNWFTRFLTIRAGLWEIINETSDLLHNDLTTINNIKEWRFLILGYTSACLLARMDHFLIDDIATDKLTQQKLNESSPVHRVPRKQYTKIFVAFTDPENAFLLLRLMKFLEKSEEVEKLKSDELIGDFVINLPKIEENVDTGKRRYVKRRMRYHKHSFQRRFASSKQKSTFLFLEYSGRFISSIKKRRVKRVNEKILERLNEILQPGDVMVTRHEGVATNLFLPGYWPHCALYIGTESERKELDISFDDKRTIKSSGEKSVLEALKDGVLFRDLKNTLNVDAVAIVRPILDKENIKVALERVSKHEGKGYNFDFDFFRADKLVCTEVIYRAYDQLGIVKFDLQERSGRMTLSAEDILDLALKEDMFKVVALFGSPGCRKKVVINDRAKRLVIKSYK